MIAHRSELDSSQRRGLISVVVLIALIVIAMVCAGLLRVALARRLEVAREERRVQAIWLAESGLARASARLTEAEPYMGETWEIPAEELGGRGAGLVLIRVEPVSDHPDQRRIRVQADYPQQSSHRARRSLEAVVMIIPKSR